MTSPSLLAIVLGQPGAAMGVRAFNTFEKSEFLLDSATSGTLNFSVVGSYEGQLDSTLLRKGLGFLQMMHPLLWMSPNSAEKVSHYVQTHAQCPLKVLPYSGPDQWKDLVRGEVTRRFNKVDEPLWRVTLLQGENKGQLIVTFHHAIADGVCAMEVLNHLFGILSDLKQDRVPELDAGEQKIPDLESLYHLSPADPKVSCVTQTGNDLGYHTNFVTGKVKAENVVKWNKAQGVRMNGTLLGALVLAIRRVMDPKVPDFSAISAVNFRSSFKPPLSKEVLTLMRTCLSDTVSAEKETDFATLARTIDQGLHSQLQRGQHVANLKLTEALLERGISGIELWRRSKFPENGACVTNVGQLGFSGDYAGLSLRELFFCANVVPFLQKANNMVLSAVTFRDELSLSLWFIDELVKEPVGKEVLDEVKRILSSL